MAYYYTNLLLSRLSVLLVRGRLCRVSHMLTCTDTNTPLTMWCARIQEHTSSTELNQQQHRLPVFHVVRDLRMLTGSTDKWLCLSSWLNLSLTTKCLIWWTCLSHPRGVWVPSGWVIWKLCLAPSSSLSQSTPARSHGDYKRKKKPYCPKGSACFKALKTTSTASPTAQH